MRRHTRHRRRGTARERVSRARCRIRLKTAARCDPCGAGRAIAPTICRLAEKVGYTHVLGLQLPSLDLSPVQRGQIWRVRITWPNGAMRHFGKFTSEKEAVEWVTDHPWLTDRQTENTVAEPRAADQPSPRTLSRRPKFRQGRRPRTQCVLPQIS
jgi:hypothetical protein